MNRLTTEKPRGNVENALNLFYIKDKETWIRGGGPAPEYKDEKLDNFMRRMIKEKMPETKIPDDTLSFGDMMYNWLFDDPESDSGMLALLYAAAWGFATIRERLKRYEDTGAMPDVLEDLLKHLDRIESLGGWDLVDRWVKATSEGRLVELKCVPAMKPYTKNSVYIVEDGEIFGDFVTEVMIGENENREVVSLYGMSDGHMYAEHDFGKIVFFREEDAEEALAADKNAGCKQVKDLYDEDGGDVYE